MRAGSKTAQDPLRVCPKARNTARRFKNRAGPLRLMDTDTLESGLDAHGVVTSTTAIRLLFCERVWYLCTLVPAGSSNKTTDFWFQFAEDTRRTDCSALRGLAGLLRNAAAARNAAAVAALQ